MAKISLIIPLYNEAASLFELHRRISEVTSTALQEHSIEIIMVNDGSTDGSEQIIQRLAITDTRIRIISFAKNQGKSHALTAGFRKATGRIIVTLDGDLQDRPENIPTLIEKIENGYDLVVGWKKFRNDPLGKIIPSRIFNSIIRLTWKTALHDNNCGLKAMKKPVADILHLSRHEHRFIPVFAKQAGFSLTEVAITHDARKYGHSKYGWFRLADGLHSYFSLLFSPSLKERKSSPVANLHEPNQ